MLKKICKNVTSLADPIKLFIFANKEFFRFLLLCLIILLSMIFFLYVTNTQTKVITLV